MLSNLNNFATFKYQHTGAAARTRKHWIFIGLFVAIGMGVFLYARNAFPFGIMAFVVAAVIYAAAPKYLMLGSRYFLCGDVIVYYANVVRITLSPSQGTLRLRTVNGHEFVLERDKFPTGARHEPKIRINKGLKFDKVSSKMIEKIREAQPHVEQIGC
ncbi:MAG: hypothetical protein RIR79_515 [Pseudomonadota bacterium]|jgi:hypothetical protein